LAREIGGRYWTMQMVTIKGTPNPTTDKTDSSYKPHITDYDHRHLNYFIPMFLSITGTRTNKEAFFSVIHPV
jgi:hypothetical protein